MKRLFFSIGLILFSIMVGCSKDSMSVSESVLEAEHNATMNLVKYENVDITAIANGNWSNPVTWGGQVPTAGQDVLIPVGVEVVLESQTEIKTLRVDGNIKFSRTANWSLKVDTVIVAHGGYWNMGTKMDPVLSNGEVVFTDGPIDLVYDPKRFSKGLITHGKVDIYGKTKLAWSNATSVLNVGVAQVVLQDVPSNWSVGDSILIPGDIATQDELRPVLQINGNTVTVAPLTFSHNSGEGFKTPIANLSRNIKFSSESLVTAERGHTMFMHNNDVEIAFAEFNNLGRTDKSVRISTTNARGRYAVHMHRTNQEEEVEITGIVVNNSVGWGITNHSSNVIVKDCVTYDVLGAGFVTEAGDELGSFVHNLSVRSTGSGEDRHIRKDIGDFGHSGHGFWTQGSDVSLVDNVSFGHVHSGFMTHPQGFKEPDTGIVADTTSSDRPIAEYARNIAHYSEAGHDFEWVSRQNAHSAIVDCTTYHCLYGFRCRNSKIDIIGGEFRGPNNGKGIGLHYVTAYHGNGDVSNVTVTGFEYGMYIGDSDDTTVTGGIWDNEFDFRIAEHQDAEAHIDVPDSTFFFRNNAHNNQPVSTFFTKRARVWINGKRAYFDCQRPNFVRWPTGTNIYVGMTNQQIFNQYGLLPKGEMLPPGAIPKGTYHIMP